MYFYCNLNCRMETKKIWTTLSTPTTIETMKMYDFYLFSTYFLYAWLITQCFPFEIQQEMLQVIFCTHFVTKVGDENDLEDFNIDNTSNSKNNV